MSRIRNKKDQIDILNSLYKKLKEAQTQYEKDRLQLIINVQLKYII